MATTATDGADGAAASQLVSAGAGAGAGAGATGGGSGSGVEASNGTAPQTGAGGDDDAAAVAASSTEVPWEDLEVLLQGAPLCKFGRRGDPHYRHFELSADCTILSWYSSRKREADSRGMTWVCDFGVWLIPPLSLTHTPAPLQSCCERPTC